MLANFACHCHFSPASIAGPCMTPFMKIITLILLFVLAALPQHSTAAGFLHARGQDIIDAQGQKIMLRGVGLGTWLLPEGYMWRFGERGDRPRKIEQLVTDCLGPDQAAHFWQGFRSNYISEADIQRIAEL